MPPSRQGANNPAGPNVTDAPRPAAARLSVLHFELRSSIHVAHAFNLSAAELDRAVLNDWRRGEVVVFGERRWEPDRSRLKIYEGPRLDGPALSFGRGWANAVKRGEDVTERILGSPTERQPSARISPELDALRREVLAQCATARIGVHQVLWLTNRWYPERRASERLALAEAALWGLLHERRVGLRRLGGEPADEPVAQADWEGVLLDWKTWADAEQPAVLIERPPTGRD